jgi:hypothetical protein
MRAARRTRIALGSTLFAALALGCFPAQAGTPFLVQHREARGAIKVVGSDGRSYLVGLDAQLYAPAAAPPSGWLEVSITSCSSGSCAGSSRAYSLPLSAAQLSFNSDATTATVSTRFGGLPLTLSWSGGSAAPSVAVSVNSGGGVSDPKNGGPASLVATVMGVARCPGVGLEDDSTPMLISEHIVSADGAPSASGSAALTKLPAGFVVKRGKAPMCVKSVG